MKKPGLFIMGFLFLFGMAWFCNGEMTAEEILKKVDYNMAPGSVVYDAKMIIHHPDRTDTKELKLYGKGEEKSFLIFQSPLRDKGVAVLRIEGNIWMYYPSAEKTTKLTGQMLKQGFMGSDFSFADSTERLKLLEKYEAVLKGAETVDGQKTYRLDLKARKEDASYFERRMWVDSERFIILKQEMYAKSGKLLKISSAEEIKLIGTRYYATKVRMEDKLKKNTFTEMIFTNIVLDQAIPESTFTLGNLEKKR